MTPGPGSDEIVCRLPKAPASLLGVVEDDKLLVFISWSKDLAREVALAVREYLNIVFDPVVLPWMSDQDVELGSRNMAELGETLDRSSFGIVVVTKANQYSQWINFEAGALSKKVGDPAVSVIPLLVDFDSPTDLTGPLAQFQATIYGRDELLRMMLVIALRAGVSQRTVEQRFASHWTTFDDQVKLALKDFPAEASTPERGKEDKTDEMLAILQTTTVRATCCSAVEKLVLSRLALSEVARQGHVSRRFLHTPPSGGFRGRGRRNGLERRIRQSANQNSGGRGVGGRSDR